MQKFQTPLMFICPVCKERFEFDNVEEHQLVPCPMCGVDFITYKKNQTMLLGFFE